MKKIIEIKEIIKIENNKIKKKDEIKMDYEKLKEKIKKYELNYENKRY